MGHDREHLHRVEPRWAGHDVSPTTRARRRVGGVACVAERWGSQLAGLVFPASCPGCGARGEPVCTPCAATLLPAPDAPPPPGIDDWAAAFSYQGVARELVARMKYRNARAAVAWLAGPTAAAAPEGDPGTVVAWVPTTPDRRRRRGFDHAELLARAVAARLGLPAQGLLRRLPGPPQTGLPRAARVNGPELVPRARRVGARSVLLVDDVSTTGASLAVAAATLRASGARYVRAITIARTPYRRPPPTVVTEREFRHQP